jgi:hypothetical protein
MSIIFLNQVIDFNSSANSDSGEITSSPYPKKE